MMDTTPQKSVIKFSGVTGDMLDAAEGLLRDLDVRRMSKKYSNRDVLFEILEVALSIVLKPGGLVKSEEEWSQFFKGCKVVVEDPTVGREMVQKSLKTAEAFTALIGSVAQDKAIVIPLEEYPGVSLFEGLQK